MSNKNTAIILAAGLGSRLDALTAHAPKCLVEVNGVPILHRMLFELQQCPEIQRILIVVGYLKECIINNVREHFDNMDIAFVCNPDFATTGSIQSLQHALNEEIDGSVLLIEGDVVCQQGVVSHFLKDSLSENQSSTLLTSYNPQYSGTFCQIKEGTVVSWDHESQRNADYAIEQSYKTVNITFIHRNDFLIVKQAINRLCDSAGVSANIPLEYAMQIVIEEGLEIQARIITSNEWFEVDTPVDLSIANQLFFSMEN